MNWNNTETVQSGSTLDARLIDRSSVSTLWNIREEETCRDRSFETAEIKAIKLSGGRLNKDVLRDTGKPSEMISTLS